MAKYLVAFQDAKFDDDYDEFFLCDNEADAQELCLALREQALYEAYCHGVMCYDDFVEEEFWQEYEDNKALIDWCMTYRKISEY